MSDIPRDILDKAQACYLECEQMDSDGIVATIAQAILAERERGASIADNEADKLKLRDVTDKRRDPLNKQIVAMKVICRDIASLIRKEA